MQEVFLLGKTIAVHPLALCMEEVKAQDELTSTGCQWLNERDGSKVPGKKQNLKFVSKICERNMQVNRS